MARRSRPTRTEPCREATCPALSAPEARAPQGGCECGRNAELEAVLASTLDPVVTIDSFGTIRTASNSVERVFGWRPQELVGKNVHMLMPEPHHSRHDGYLAAYRNTLRTNILGRAREFEAVRRDGARFPIELSVSRVDVPRQELPLFVGVIRDISERRRAEREAWLLQSLTLAISQSSELGAALMEALKRICDETGWDCGEVWIPDDEKGVLAEGPAWYARTQGLGAFERATHGLSFRKGEGLPGRVWASGDTEWLGAATDGLRCRRAGAAARCGIRSGAAVPIKAGDRMVAVLAFFMREPRNEDASLLASVRAAVAPLGPVIQRKQAEDELARHHEHLNDLVAVRTRELEESHEQLRLTDRLAAIGTLAAGLGHDMNNVLLPVRTRLNALGSMELSEGAREHLTHIRKSCVYLQQLTDGLHMLALSPDEPDGSASTDLGEWWSTVGPLLSRAVPNSVRFEADIPPKLPRVPVAPHKLTQAVLNLVVNAGEAIQSMQRRPHRGAQVRLWAHAAPSGREVHLGVTDTGPGMTPEVRARAFDAFFTTKKRGLGTGLGLSLVRSVTAGAGGEIDLATKPGKGTEIVLTFPVSPGRATSVPAAVFGAAVYSPDQRAASMVCHILDSAGWGAVRTTEPRPPHGADTPSIWITAPTGPALRAALVYAKGRGRAMVALGAPPAAAAWTRLGALIVEDPRDFEALRDAVGRAISIATGGHP
jgi:PAS domain S-box-containing protein